MQRGAWRVKVGLEVHARILARSKLMSGASCLFDGDAGNANGQVALFDMGMPGTLPQVNRECVVAAVRTGLALGGNVHEVSKFERKHYFYGDSPLGYQITQQRWPIVSGGELDFRVVEDKAKVGSSAVRRQKVRITRIQLEQDTGRSLESGDSAEVGAMLVDLNRAGSGVMEIVTEPDMNSAGEASAFCESIRELLERIKTCDGNMQTGSIRFDVNVSVHNDERGIDSHRVEVKNINSFKFVEKAVGFEFERLTELYGHSNSDGQAELYGHETRAFDMATGTTLAMRSKETTADYRFLPEPDLVPLQVSRETIHEVEQSMPELPNQLVERLCSPPLSLPNYEALVLLGERGATEYFEAVILALVIAGPEQDHAKVALAAARCIGNVLIGHLRQRNMSLNKTNPPPDFIAKLVLLESTGKISLLTSKRVLKKVLDAKVEAGEQKFVFENPEDIVAENGWAQIDDPKELDALCMLLLQDLKKNKKAKKNLRLYHEGKTQLLEFFFGLAMGRAQGRANTKLLREALQRALDLDAA